VNAVMLQAAIRKRIQSGMPPPNAALTIALKGSSKPLVGRTNALFDSVKAIQSQWNRAFIGVLRKDPAHDVAETVHNGKEIPVTKKMRGMFWILFLVSQGRYPASVLTGRAAELWSMMPGGWKPLSKSTIVIKVPPRPFIKGVFDDDAIGAIVLKNWQDAIERAIKEVTGGASGGTTP